MWLNPYEQSKWAFEEIKKDRRKIKELKHLIIDSEWALTYCKKICNDPEVRKYITRPMDCYFYCVQIRFSHDVHSRIPKDIKKIKKQNLKMAMLRWQKRKKK